MALDDEFAIVMTDQIRLFLFAGNDTTSSTIVFMFHFLSKHPKALSKQRKKHNSVFGPDTSQAADLLMAQPALLKQKPYTLGVIKETLRLYPPAINMRQGMPGVFLTALDGTRLHTDGFYVIANHQAFHQNSRVWKRPEEFLPERWVVEPGHGLHPSSSSSPIFRPFDAGSRGCIGERLPINEMRTVMIMVARQFDLKPAYDEWDRLQIPNAGLWARFAGSLSKKEINTVKGDRAYQTEKAGTHPSDGYLCRVSQT